MTEHGAIGANNLVLNALVEPGDEVIAVTPTYQQLQSIPEAIGATVVTTVKEGKRLPPRMLNNCGVSE